MTWLKEPFNGTHWTERPWNAGESRHFCNNCEGGAVKKQTNKKQLKNFPKRRKEDDWLTHWPSCKINILFPPAMVQVDDIHFLKWITCDVCVCLPKTAAGLALAWLIACVSDRRVGLGMIFGCGSAAAVPAITETKLRWRYSEWH